jgi:hypothetical protein
VVRSCVGLLGGVVVIGRVMVVGGVVGMEVLCCLKQGFCGRVEANRGLGGTGIGDA